MNTFIYFKKTAKVLLIFNILAAIVYYTWWFNISNIGNPVLYFLLFFGETYHVLMSILFTITIWPHEEKLLIKGKKINPSVDIFITVAGEPVEIVERTLIAIKNIVYDNFKIYILNDSYVAKKNNWQDFEILAKRLGVNCITRKNPGGAKAGNINNALRQTTGELVVIFDADMVPYSNFLKHTVPYFKEKNIAFVQSPQFYENSAENEITAASWEQQSFFFGPIMNGKNNYNSAFICGTNVVIRRSALLQAGGMEEKNIAEDFLTSLKIHALGWKSIYIPDILATGLAPLDLLSYYKQQKRWARGSLEVLFSENPIFKKGLSFSQKREYLASAFFYLNGLIVLIDILIPLIFLFFGLSPVSTSTMSFALFFMPFMFLNMLILYIVSGYSITFRALSFSQSSFVLQLSALKSVIFKEKSAFAVTSKKALNGNFIYLLYPHLIYILLAIVSLFFAIPRSGFSSSVVANLAWTMFNISMFFPFINAAKNLNYKHKQVNNTSANLNKNLRYGTTL